MTDPIRLRDMTWRERGAHDFAQGEPREPGPFPAGTAEGDDWRAAWDLAQSAAPEEGDIVLRVASVKLSVDERGRFHLVDSQGRVLGAQSYINVEQAEHGHNVTVTFSEVEIAYEAPQCTL